MNFTIIERFSAARALCSLFVLSWVLGWGGGAPAFGQPAPAARAKITAGGQNPATAPHQPILALPASGPVSAILTAQSFNFTPTSFAWSQVAPASVLAQHIHAAQSLVTFSATSGTQVTATFPARGIYQLQLTASDGTTTVTGPVWVQVWDRLSGFNPLQRIGRNPGLTPPSSMRQLTPDPGPFRHPRLLFTDAEWSELNAKTTSSTEVAAAITTLRSALNSNFDKTSAPVGVLRTYANALVAWADGGFTDAAFTASVQPVRQFDERFRFGNEPSSQFPDALLVSAYLQWVKVNPALAQTSVSTTDQNRFRYLAKVSAAAARAELVRVRLGATASPPLTLPFSHDLAVVYDLLYNWMTDAQRTDLRDYLFTIGYGYYNTGNGGLQRSPAMTVAAYRANGDFPNQMDPALLSSLVIEGEESAVTPSVVAANVPVEPAVTGPAAWPNASPAAVWNTYRMARWYSERLITPWGSPLNHHAYLDFSTGFSGPAMLALARRGQNIFVTSNLYQSSLHAFNNLNPRPSDGAMVLWDHHDSLGFGTGPNVYAGRYLARYLWPDDPLIDTVYRSFRTEVSSPLLTAMFHIDRAPSTLAQTAQSKGLSLTRFDPYRGYGVTRNTWSDNDLSLYFESRPDVQGHMHAEANNFSLYALGRAWASPPGYHITVNESASTVLIQDPALAATDTVTGGFVGQSPSSATTTQTRDQFPTPPGKFLEATEDPAGKWTLFAGDATAAYQYAFERDQPVLDTGRRIADFFYGEALSVMFAGYDPAADTTTLKVPNLAYNPVQFALRSVFSVRGSKPYVLVIDDITADGVTPRNYRWNMSAAVSFGNAGGRFVDANNNDIFSSLRLQSGATSSDAVLFHLRDSASGPRLLVRDLSPKAAGQPAIFIDTRPSTDPRGALTYGYDNNTNQFSLISTNRLLIPRNNVVSPDYKVLLFPHQSGSSLPLTSWNTDQTVATIDLRDGFTDRLTFDGTHPDRRTRVAVFTRTSSGRSAPTLTVPANITVQAAPATLAFTGQPGAAVAFTVTATSDTGAALTPALSSPSGTVFPVGANTVYATATDAFGQITSRRFTINVVPAAPAVTVVSATNLAAQPVGLGLRWPPVTRATAYSVKRTTSPGGPYTVVSDRQPASTLTFSEAGLASGAYFYVVTSWFDTFEGAPCPEIPITVSTGPFGASIVGSQNAGFGAYRQGDTYLLTCTGGQIGGSSDQTSFLSLPWSGDGVFTVRLASVSGSGGSVSGSGTYGIVMRQNSTANGLMAASAFNTFSRPVQLLTRATAGANAVGVGPATNSSAYPSPRWLRLARAGNTFTAFHSVDGITWEQTAASATVPFSGSTLVGLAGGGQNSTLTSIAFDNVAFVKTPALSATLSAVTLDWTGSVAAGYTVSRGTSAAGPFTPLASNLTGTTYTDNTVVMGQTYHYVVSALGETGLTTDSAPVQVAILVPGSPANLVVTPGFTTNTLSWSAGANAVYYFIKRATSPEGPFTLLATVNSDQTDYTDTSLGSGVSYYYIITASSGSAESDATPIGSGVPVAGTLVKTNNVTPLGEAASWTPAAVPNLLDVVHWNGTYSNGSVSIGSGLSANRLLLGSLSTAITVNAGTGPLTLGSGGIDLSASTQNLTLNAPVTLAASQTWTIASGRTLTLASPISAGGSSRAITFAGSGTLTYNGTGEAVPFPGPFSASGGTLRANQASAVLTINAANLPAGSSNTLTSLTGASGATWVIDAAPSASLTFASNVAGLNLVIKNGAVTYNANGGATDATNVRVEGGTFTANGARYQLAATNQTLQVTGGTVDLRAATGFGFRLGGSGSATQNGAQMVTGTQTGGSLLATTFSLGGTDTTVAKSPSYSLTGGVFAVASGVQIGADTAGVGSSTFSLGGTGKLIVPGNLSGAASNATQVFAFSGGTLVAGTIIATNLRSSAGASNGTFVQSGGTLAPGDLGTAGRTAITGNYTLGAGGTLAVDIGGATQASAYQNGQYDTVAVDQGTTTFSGSLAIRLINGYVPPNATSFTVLTSAGTLTGTFGQRLATTGGEGSFLVNKVGNNVTLSGYLNALQTWRLTHFATSANTGTSADSADFDGDGASNLLEYALGTNAASAASVSVPTPQVSGLRLQLSFLRARSDVTYLIEASSDLTPGSWSVIATNPGTVGQSVTVIDTVNLPTANPPRRFLRLRVTSP